MSQLSQSQCGDFPVNALPEGARHFALEASKAIGVDPAVIAGPCLAAMAGVIGNSRQVVIKPGSWSEPAVLWLLVVSASGTKKTPSIAAVIDPLHRQEALLIEAAEEARKDYEEEKREYDAADRKNRGEPPVPPEPAPRHLVSDITTEGLLLIHSQSPRGLLLHRDELGGWFRSFNAYKAGGGDAQTWCEVHQGRPAIVDRKSSAATISVPRASVSIVGGIQPGIAREVLSGEHLVDGVAARCLFAVADNHVPEWSEATISEEVSKGWADLLEQLLGVEPYDDGSPHDLTLSAEAKSLFVSFHDALAARIEDSDGPLRSALSKLSGGTARLALVVQLGTDPWSTEIDATSMEAGVSLSLWFEEQARQMYADMARDEAERERKALMDWIADQGGKCSVRQLSRFGPHRFRKKAKEHLDDLVEHDLAEVEVTVGRNRAPRYILTPPKPCDNCDN